MSVVLSLNVTSFLGLGFFFRFPVGMSWYTSCTCKSNLCHSVDQNAPWAELNPDFTFCLREESKITSVETKALPQGGGGNGDLISQLGPGILIW